MTSSRSNSRLALLAVFVLAGWLWLPAVAQAGRKRVVVLELEGPKAEKFHEDLVRLLKKSHTVIPVDKWTGTAEELEASKLNDKDVKKVAKKLKIDAVISGRVEKRRDEYILQLKIREGKTGEVVGNRVDVKASGPRLDSTATSDLKDELIPLIDGMGSNRGGSADEEEDSEKPSKKPKKGGDEEGEDEEKPAKKGFGKKPAKGADEEGEDEEKPAKKGKKPAKGGEEGEDEEKPAKKGFGRHDEEETNALRTKKPEGDEEEKPAKKAKKPDEEEDNPLPKPKKVKKADEGEEEGEAKPKKKKVAAKGEDEEGVEASGGEEEEPTSAEALSPAERAVDAVIGLSINARRMAFTFASDLASKPPPYKGVPVAGLLIDATIYPLAIGHKRHGMAKNFGISAMYDKVLKISSKSGGMTLATSEARFAIGAAFRYPLGAAAVVGGTLRFGRQNFTISGMADIPNVNYTIIDPSVTFRYSVNPKLTFNASLGVMLFLDTGQIAKQDQYGAATVTGFEGEFGGEYALTKNLFARAAFKFETIGFKFKGAGMLSTGRDADADQDVFGARDSYLGGAATVGYLY